MKNNKKYYQSLNKFKSAVKNQDVKMIFNSYQRDSERGLFWAAHFLDNEKKEHIIIEINAEKILPIFKEIKKWSIEVGIPFVNGVSVIIEDRIFYIISGSEESIAPLEESAADVWKKLFKDIPNEELLYKAESDTNKRVFAVFHKSDCFVLVAPQRLSLLRDFPINKISSLTMASINANHWERILKSV